MFVRTIESALRRWKKGCDKSHTVRAVKAGYFCPTPRKGKIWQKMGCDARPSEDQTSEAGFFRCKNPSRQCRSCTLILATAFALSIMRTRARWQGFPSVYPPRKKSTFRTPDPIFYVFEGMGTFSQDLMHRPLTTANVAWGCGGSNGGRSHPASESQLLVVLMLPGNGVVFAI